MPNPQAQGQYGNTTKTDLRLSYPTVPQSSIAGLLSGFRQQTSAMKAPFVFGVNHQPQPITHHIPPSISRSFSHPIPRSISHSIPQSISQPIPRSISQPIPRFITHPTPRSITHPTPRSFSPTNPHPSNRQISSQPLAYNQRQSQPSSNYAQWQEQYQLRNCRPYETGRKR